MLNLKLEDFKIKVKKILLIKWMRNSVYSLFFICFFLSLSWLANVVYPLALPNQQADFATVVLDDEGYPLRAFADKNGVWRYHVNLDEVSPEYLNALIAYEDKYFYHHFGVNPISFVRAAWQYVINQRIISGGSTLTMQVARLLHPHERTLLGKLKQISRAFQLEWHLSKQEILSLYINYAPFGGTLEGVQAASYQYLRKPVSDLRPAEAALLAVLPQAPSYYRPDRHPKRATLARDKVIDRLSTQGIWSKQKAESVKQEPVVVWEPEQPLTAPLLARRLKQENPHKGVIKTFIQRGLQEQISRYVLDYAASQGEGVSMAVLVVDNQTQHVISYVGSSSILDSSRAGHVDMVRAIRSPGSTLKPLLFGLAIDDNLIHSQSLLADVPRLNSRYRPGNFSNGFDGPVSATRALQRSLNIPFVQLIEAYGEQKFVNKLKHVLQPLVIPGSKANAAVILGGAGASLQSLVSLHSSFANEGWVKPLIFEDTKLSPQKNKQTGRRLMSEAAAWITWKTLTGLTPPEQFSWGLSKQTRPILAWKTGTSWSSRDAWAIGSTKLHTIGIWVGKPNGEPLRNALGVTTAAPALFSILDMLQGEHLKGKSLQPKRPFTVEDKEICWPDGRSVNLVKEGCDRHLFALTKDGVTPRTLQIESGAAVHNAMQNIIVEPNNHLRLLGSCGELTGEVKQVGVWPRQLEPWLPARERRTARIPKYSSECLTIPTQDETLTIVGITDKQQLYRQASESIQKQIYATGAFGKVSWYLNGENIANQAEPLHLKLAAQLNGEMELVAVDEHGISGRIVFAIKDDLISSDE